MDNIRIPKKILNEKFYGKGRVGTPRLKWESNIIRES
jgi:hypothetical protein